MGKLRRLVGLWAKCQRAVCLCEPRIFLVLELALVLKGQKPCWLTRSHTRMPFSTRMLVAIAKGILDQPPSWSGISLLVGWMNDWFAGQVFVDGRFGTGWGPVSG